MEDQKTFNCFGPLSCLLLDNIQERLVRGISNAKDPLAKYRTGYLLGKQAINCSR